MNINVPVSKDGGGVQHGDSVQKAVKLVGEMLEQIQIELEKILPQGGKVPVSSIPVMCDLFEAFELWV